MPRFSTVFDSWSRSDISSEETSDICTTDIDQAEDLCAQNEVNENDQMEDHLDAGFDLQNQLEVEAELDMDHSNNMVYHIEAMDYDDQ